PSLRPPRHLTSLPTRPSSDLIRERSGCTVLAIRSAADGRFISNPTAETVLQAGDTMIVLGTAAALEALQRHGGAKNNHRIARLQDRKSTRLNSSHGSISYAHF